MHVFAGELAGVEQFLGQDALVAIHISVVAQGEELDLLVPGPLGDDPGGVAGSGAGPVVGDDPVDVGNAVGDDQTLARARNPATIVPFSSGSGSV